MNPILRLVFALVVVCAVISFIISVLTPNERARVWSLGLVNAALALLVLWLYWDILTRS